MNLEIIGALVKIGIRFAGSERMLEVLFPLYDTSVEANLAQVHPFIAAPGWTSVEPAFTAAEETLRAAQPQPGPSTAAPPTTAQPSANELEEAQRVDEALRSLKQGRPADFKLRELDFLRVIGQDEILKVRPRGVVECAGLL